VRWNRLYISGDLPDNRADWQFYAIAAEFQGVRERFPMKTVSIAWPVIRRSGLTVVFFLLGATLLSHADIVTFRGGEQLQGDIYREIGRAHV